MQLSFLTKNLKRFLATNNASKRSRLCRTMRYLFTDKLELLILDLDSRSKLSNQIKYTSNKLLQIKIVRGGMQDKVALIIDIVVIIFLNLVIIKK